MNHKPGCPRLQFWDAGDHEADCTCEFEDDIEEDDKVYADLYTAMRRIRFLRKMMEEAKANIGVPGEGYAAPIAYAYVSPEHLACYPHEDGTVRDWAGAVLGTYRIIASRPAIFFGHHSWIGSRYFYMRATVQGRTYSVRGFGPGMLARGRAVKEAA